MSKFIKFIKNNKMVSIISGAVGVVAIGTAVVYVLASSPKEVTVNSNHHRNIATSTVSTSTPKKEETKKKEETSVVPSSITAPAVSQPASDLTAMNVIYYAKESVNIRSGRDVNSNIISTLVDNQAIQVTGKTTDGWYQVNWQGTTGYVKADYLTETQKVSQQSSSQTTSNTSSGSNSTSSGNDSSSQPAVQQQPSQPVQQTYTAGIDWSMTNQVNSAGCEINNVYTGVKRDTVYNYAQMLATGQISQSQAINELNTMVWNESASAFYGGNQTVKFNFYGTIVSIINVPDASASYRDIVSRKFGDLALFDYQRACVYRNSDGTMKVVTVAVGITYQNEVVIN